MPKNKFYVILLPFFQFKSSYFPQSIYGYVNGPGTTAQVPERKLTFHSSFSFLHITNNRFSLANFLSVVLTLNRFGFGPGRSVSVYYFCQFTFSFMRFVNSERCVLTCFSLKTNNTSLKIYKTTDVFTECIVH